MRREDLVGLLAGWHRYELPLLDAESRPNAGRLDEIALAVRTAEHDRPVLPTVAGCRLWYCGHDDCYGCVESTDRRAAGAVFRRLLALLVGSALVTAEPVDVAEFLDVAEPADSLVEELIGQHRHWVGVLGEVVAQDAVTVDLSATAGPWRLSQPLPRRVDRVVVYRVAEATWSITGP